MEKEMVAGKPLDFGDAAIGEKEVRIALARAVASRQVPDKAINAVAKRLIATKLPIRRIDICTYGICIDYFFTDDRWATAVKDLVKVGGADIRQITVFPWGIPFPDIFRVRVEQQFEELGALGEGPGR